VSSELQPVEVHPKRAGPEFWRRHHAFRRLRHAETRPDDPIRPDDVDEKRMRRDDPFETHYYYEITRDGTMLSWFSAQTAKPGSPGYDSNKHIFEAGWSVHRDHRRHGIGGLWLPLVLELMDRHGCTVLGTGAEEDSGHAFLRWLGADPKLTETENRLKLSAVDWAMVRRWIDDGPKRSPQTRLELYDGGVPEAMWDDYAPQISSMLNMVPFDELDHGETVVTPETLREWYERGRIGGERLHAILTREPDGVISGMTDCSWAPHRPTLIHQQFTGVRPDARGRGLGKWIKAAMLEHIRAVHPEAEWISTENANSNAPMLAINQKLGFKPYRTGIEYQMSRERLAARVQELAAKT
jgi:GNAT superfamily N-acetyltransferase